MRLPETGIGLFTGMFKANQILQILLTMGDPRTFLTMGDPQWTMGFSTKSWSNDINDDWMIPGIPRYRGRHCFEAPSFCGHLDHDDLLMIC